MKPFQFARILACPGTPDLTEAELRDATADYHGFMEEFSTNLFDYLKPPICDRRSRYLQRFEFVLSMGDSLTVFVTRLPPPPVTLESLAPEMEPLLREAMDYHSMCIFCGPVDDPLRTVCPNPSGHFYNRVRALLNRLDAARKDAP